MNIWIKTYLTINEYKRFLRIVRDYNSNIEKVLRALILSCMDIIETTNEKKDGLE